MAYSEVEVLYLDTETKFELIFGNAQDLSAGQIYTSFAPGSTLLVPGLHAGFDWEGLTLNVGTAASSGEVTFHRYDATGMAGSVDVELVDFESYAQIGSVSGTFNVTFELDDF